MNQASYKLLKYIPDPVRNEPVNIGILAWYASHAIIRFDPHAVARAVTRDRDLGEDVLQVVVDEIATDLNDADLKDERDFLDFVRSTMRGPFVATDTRPFGIPNVPDSAVPAVLSNEVDALIDRLVKPVRRRSVRSAKSPRLVLVDRYQRFLAPDQLETSYEVKHTETGLPRKVDLFVNHGVDTAVDIMDLRRDTSRDTAIEAADAIKAKSQDILEGHEVKLVIVHLPADIRPSLEAYVPVIKQMLQTVPEMRLTSSTEENVELVRALTDHDAPGVRTALPAWS